MFIVASSQYIEQIIESLAVVIHENSQKIATEVSKNSNQSIYLYNLLILR